LNAALDELAGDWIMHQGTTGRDFYTDRITLAEFVQWSAQQSERATPLKNASGQEIDAVIHSKPRKSHRVWHLELYPVGPKKHGSPN
jgi:hypothetical protein